MSKKPGVMIYFDIMPTLKMLSDREAGLLFRAIMEYGQDKTMPQLPDRLAVIWPLIQMRINIDDDRYNMTAQKRQYACYVRWRKERGEEIMSFNRWMAEGGGEDEDLDYPA